MTSQWALRATMALSLFMSAGCAVTIPLDANMRIDVDGRNYSQRGQEIDKRDMVDKLEKEPAAAQTITTAKTLAVFSTALSAIGGAAIGWPLGESITGKPDPHWWMAGVGAGLFLLGGLPLSFASNQQVGRAVEIHNAGIAERERREAREKQEQEKEEQRAKAKSLRPLPEGFGFAFDKGPEDAVALCQAVGYQWNEKDGAFVCSGLPTSEVEGASAELSFADGRISRLRIFVHPQDDADRWATAIVKVESSLVRMYGKPTQRDFSVPSECAGTAFMGCVKSGKVTGRSSWFKNPERAVSMAIVSTAEQPMIVVDVTRVRPAAAP